MCRFVAVISKDDIPLQPYFSFLLNQAKNGKRAPHPDGFGFWIKSSDGNYIYKSTLPIWENNVTVPNGKIGFFHARKMGESGAKVDIRNVHPFVRDGVFMHNGVLSIPKNPKAIGDTDTESFFLTLLDYGVKEGIEKIIGNYDFKSLNFVMYYKEKIYVLRLAKEMQEYFTIFIKREGERIIISTEKDEEEWEEVENGKLWVINPDLHIKKFCVYQDMCH